MYFTNADYLARVGQLCFAEMLQDKIQRANAFELYGQKQLSLFCCCELIIAARAKALWLSAQKEQLLLFKAK